MQHRNTSLIKFFTVLNCFVSVMFAMELLNNMFQGITLQIIIVKYNVGCALRRRQYLLGTAISLAINQSVCKVVQTSVFQIVGRDSQGGHKRLLRDQHSITKLKKESEVVSKISNVGFLLQLLFCDVVFKVSSRDCQILLLESGCVPKTD